MTRQLSQLLEEYEPVIGLEVHVQLATHTKIFSGSATHFGAPPNSLVDPARDGHARHAARVQQGRSSSSRCASASRPVRRSAPSRGSRAKHYFYPDQPKGYQISQYDEPLLEHGHVDLLIERRREARQSHAHSSRGGRGQEHARGRGLARRSQSRGRSTMRGRQRARDHERRGSRGIHGARCTVWSAGSASPRPTWRRGTCAATRTCP